MHNSLKRMWALLGVVAAIGAVAATSAVASHKAGPTIVIWTDANRAASVTQGRERLGRVRTAPRSRS